MAQKNSVAKKTAKGPIASGNDADCRCRRISPSGVGPSPSQPINMPKANKASAMASASRRSGCSLLRAGDEFSVKPPMGDARITVSVPAA